MTTRKLRIEITEEEGTPIAVVLENAPEFCTESLIAARSILERCIAERLHEEAEAGQ